LPKFPETASFHGVDKLRSVIACGRNFGETQMRGVRQLLAVAGVVALATVGGAAAQTSAPADAGLRSFAQADKPSAVTRVKIWTRAKLDAAKKRWAANNEKFTDCQKQLVEHRKTKRLSLHRQGDFLQNCMQRKP
jgi:hypothetical protein